VTPVWHGLLSGAHALPEVHPTHCPPLQTWLVPHGVPSAAFCIVSVQMIPPSTHEAAP
jgi:hypothetical protein